MNTLILPKGPIHRFYVSHWIPLSSLPLLCYSLCVCPCSCTSSRNSVAKRQGKAKTLNVKHSVNKKKGKGSWQTSGVFWACLNPYQKLFFDNRKIKEIGKGAAMTTLVKIFCARSFTVARMELVLSPSLEQSPSYIMVALNCSEEWFENVGIYICT